MINTITEQKRGYDTIQNKTTKYLRKPQKKVEKYQQQKARRRSKYNYAEKLFSGIEIKEKGKNVYILESKIICKKGTKKTNRPQFIFIYTYIPKIRFLKFIYCSVAFVISLQTNLLKQTLSDSSKISTKKINKKEKYIIIIILVGRVLYK